MAENITPDEGMHYIQRLEFLPGYPRTDEGIDALAGAFARIVGDHEKAEYLIGKIVDGCSRLPAPIEMRRIFARRFPPADGQEPGTCDQFDYMDNTGGRKA